MSSKSKNIFTLARVMCLFAFIVLCVASAMSFLHHPKSFSVIPKPEYTIFIVNFISAISCLFLVFKPENWKAQCLILFIQSVSTTLTGYNTLGTFLYSALIILLFVNGFFKTQLKEKFISLCIIWAAVCFGYGIYAMNNDAFGKRGIYMFLLEISLSIFFFGFYYYVYKKIETLLVTLVPVKPLPNNGIKLPALGTELHLSDYSLTERQVKLVLEYLATQKNYEALGEQFYISKSTVKKDMTVIFEKFGVTNLKELHILLLQFIVKA